MKSPVVSIIAPVYNTGAYLEECILSVLNQSFTDWELILVDDGSTDNSVEIIQSFVSRYDNIHFLQSNAGCVSIARNTGLDIAKGEFIYFLDSDDSMLPQALELLINAAKENPEVDFLQGSFRVLNMKTGTNVKASRFAPLAHFNKRPMKGTEYLEKMGLCITYPWNSLIRRSFMDEYSIRFPEKIAFQEDLVFILSILLTDRLVMYIDNEGVLYRFGRPDSLTNIDTSGYEKNRKIKKLGESLILSAKYLSQIKTTNSVIDKMLNQRLLDNLTGFLFSARQILPDRDLINMASNEIPHIRALGIGKKQLCASLYNLSPSLALFFRRFI